MADRLPGDERVVGADRRAGLLQPGSNDAGGVRVRMVERHRIELPEKQSQALCIGVYPRAFRDPIPKLEYGDRGDNDTLAGFQDVMQSLPYRGGPAIDDRDTSIGIEQVAQEKTSRTGVCG
jgi:hypothetical protein